MRGRFWRWIWLFAISVAVLGIPPGLTADDHAAGISTNPVLKPFSYGSGDHPTVRDLTVEALDLHTKAILATQAVSHYMGAQPPNNLIASPRLEGRGGFVAQKFVDPESGITIIAYDGFDMLSDPAFWPTVKEMAGSPLDRLGKAAGLGPHYFTDKMGLSDAGSPLNEQIDQAIKFETANADPRPGMTVLTGLSGGGFLANIVAAKAGIPSIGFSAPGVPSSVMDRVGIVRAGDPRSVNYSHPKDALSTDWIAPPRAGTEISLPDVWRGPHTFEGKFLGFVPGWVDRNHHVQAPELTPHNGPPDNANPEKNPAIGKPEKNSPTEDKPDGVPKKLDPQTPNEPNPQTPNEPNPETPKKPDPETPKKHDPQMGDPDQREPKSPARGGIIDPEIKARPKDDGCEAAPNGKRACVTVKEGDAVPAHHPTNLKGDDDTNSQKLQTEEQFYSALAAAKQAESNRQLEAFWKSIGHGVVDPLQDEGPAQEADPLMEVLLRTIRPWVDPWAPGEIDTSDEVMPTWAADFIRRHGNGVVDPLPPDVEVPSTEIPSSPPIDTVTQSSSSLPVDQNISSELPTPPDPPAPSSPPEPPLPSAPIEPLDLPVQPVDSAPPVWPHMAPSSNEPPLASEVPLQEASEILSSAACSANEPFEHSVGRSVTLRILIPANSELETLVRSKADRFTQATGVRVEVTTLDASTAEKLAVLTLAEESDFDLAVVDQAAIGSLAGAGLLTELQPEDLTSRHFDVGVATVGPPRASRFDGGKFSGSGLATAFRMPFGSFPRAFDTMAVSENRVFGLPLTVDFVGSISNQCLIGDSPSASQEDLLDARVPHATSELPVGPWVKSDHPVFVRQLKRMPLELAFFFALGGHIDLATQTLGGLDTVRENVRKARGMVDKAIVDVDPDHASSTELLETFGAALTGGLLTDGIALARKGDRCQTVSPFFEGDSSGAIAFGRDIVIPVTVSGDAKEVALDFAAWLGGDGSAKDLVEHGFLPLRSCAYDLDQYTQQPRGQFGAALRSAASALSRDSLFLPLVVPEIHAQPIESDQLLDDTSAASLGLVVGN